MLEPLQSAPDPKVESFLANLCNNSMPAPEPQKPPSVFICIILSKKQSSLGRIFKHVCENPIWFSLVAHLNPASLLVCFIFSDETESVKTMNHTVGVIFGYVETPLSCKV
ncbi:hypothetical protein ILYODFUR_006135 [Ilyodon furcidens]|uniref:Uncharacterized protein n=1 Tax=Ilyodon furcidens TaxID=33524 RepID=A0ABV0VBJ6_9TELE